MAAIHALAFDLDGSLTPDSDTWGSLEEALFVARVAGLSLILTTRKSRVAARQVCEVDRLFDAAVFENGAQVAVGGTVESLTTPLDRRLTLGVAAQGAAFDAGHHLLSCDSTDEALVLEVAEGLGLELQVIRDGSRSTFQHPGISKALGMRQALRSMGIVPERVRAVGGADVGVPPLRDQADQVPGPTAPPTGSGALFDLGDVYRLLRDVLRGQPGTRANGVTAGAGP